MKLAFNGQARFAEFNDGYELYSRRKRFENPVDFKTYKNVVRDYCKMLADELEHNGIAELPCGLGMLAAATFMRKPQYRGRKFLGYGTMNWHTGKFDGSVNTFGIAFLPKFDKKNLRCYGFVANRQLFKRVKEEYRNEYRTWSPIEFNDKMV